MAKKQLGIIGAGNLGSRHLQALALLKTPCQITVMDIHRESLKKAENTFRKTKGSSRHEVCFVTEISSMPKNLDAAIIATASDVRRNVTEALLAHADVTYLILEKVLFQRLEDYNAITQLLNQKQVQTYVNCPRRMYSLYENIQKKLRNASEMEIKISGSDWGLGSNAIHMLDLIAYLAGSENLSLDGSGLDPEYQQSKRKGFLEITGTLRGSMGRCHSFSITSDSKPNLPAQTEISSDNCQIRIMEGIKELEFTDASTGWEWQKEHFTLPYQSELTNLVIEELFANGSCKLTPFLESCRLHIALQQQLIPYFEKQGCTKGICPIT